MSHAAVLAGKHEEAKAKEAEKKALADAEAAKLGAQEALNKLEADQHEVVQGKGSKPRAKKQKTEPVAGGGEATHGLTR